MQAVQVKVLNPKSEKSRQPNPGISPSARRARFAQGTCGDRVGAGVSVDCLRSRRRRSATVART